MSTSSHKNIALLAINQNNPKGNNMVHYLRKISCLIIIGIFSITFSYAEGSRQELLPTPITLLDDPKEKIEGINHPFYFPEVSQEAMVQGLLNIAKNLKVAEDFTPENIAKWLGKPLRHPKPEEKNFYFTGQVSKDWKLFFTLEAYGWAGNQQPLILFSLSENNRKLNPSPSMTDACGTCQPVLNQLVNN